MKPFRGRLSHAGYLLFTINSPIIKTYSAHRFIWETIKGPIPDGLEINHIDTNRQNSSVRNLELVTHKRNMELALSKKVIALNLETKEEKIYISIRMAEMELGICNPNISAICKKRKHHETAESKTNGQKYSFRYAD